MTGSSSDHRTQNGARFIFDDECNKSTQHALKQLKPLFGIEIDVVSDTVNDALIDAENAIVKIIEDEPER